MRKSLGGHGQPETVGWTVHVTLCVVVCYFCNSFGGSKMEASSISYAEIIPKRMNY